MEYFKFFKNSPRIVSKFSKSKNPFPSLEDWKKKKITTSHPFGEYVQRVCCPFRARPTSINGPSKLVRRVFSSPSLKGALTLAREREWPSGSDELWHLTWSLKRLSVARLRDHIVFLVHNRVYACSWETWPDSYSSSLYAITVRNNKLFPVLSTRILPILSRQTLF